MTDACDPLSVEYRSTEHGGQVFVSTWELDDQDRERIAHGGRIELSIYGQWHPPVGLEAIDAEPRRCSRPAPHVCGENGPCNGLPRT